MHSKLQLGSKFYKNNSHEVHYICLVGSSAAGKSEALKILKKHYGSFFEYPIRYTTRPPRKDDDSAENTAVSGKQFQKLVNDKLITVSWKKSLSNVGDYYYGIALQSDKHCIISGNNAFARQVYLENSVIIEIWADKESRMKRLLARSPNLSDRELQARLSAKDKLSLDNIDIRINNTGKKSQLTTALSAALALIGIGAI